MPFSNNMGYNSKHTEVKDSKSGYNTVCDQYCKYHKHLDGFDQGLFQRFLPRKEGINIIDLGAGDGRLFNFLKKLNYNHYVACDIAEKLLKKHPGTKNIEKIVCDLAEKLPFEDNYFDLATTFFVLEHLQELDMLFSETERILKSGGRWIIGHFLQRHEFVRKTSKEEFKIEFYNHRLEHLKKLADENCFLLDIFPVQEKGSTIGHILILEKK